MSAGTPKSLPSSGQKSIQDISHPLCEESLLTPSPDAANTSSSIGHKRISRSLPKEIPQFTVKSREEFANEKLSPLPDLCPDY
ncbi:sorting nexin-30 [Tachysurus ichikawai]